MPSWVLLQGSGLRVEITATGALAEEWGKWFAKEELPRASEAAQLAYFKAAQAPKAVYHGLHRTFGELREQLPDLTAVGFDAVQLPPAQLCYEGCLRSKWYLRYQPLRYGIIDPKIGGEDGLKSLCQEAAKLGVWVVADCVFNHAAVVAKRHEWERAQCDESLMEELKTRLDRTFRPELDRNDFQFPWVCLEGDKWDDPHYTYEGWGCGEWSELRFSEHVVSVHFQHLRKLIDCGVRGFRIDAAKHMRPQHVKKYVDYIRQAGGIFIYAEVLSLNREVHAQYERLGTEGARVASTDYLLAAAVREATRCADGGCPFPRLTGANRLGPEAVRFARSHDTVLNNHPICGIDWRSADEAKVAWAYLLARPEGTVVVYEEDAKVPTVQRALAFRKAAAMRMAAARARAVAGGAKVVDKTVDGQLLQAELSCWPPPTYDLVLLLLTSPSGVPVGFAAVNFTPRPVPLRLPWDLQGLRLLEVLDVAQPASMLSAGAVARLRGLQECVHLNGQRATLERWEDSRGRWMVRLKSGEFKSVRPEHLQADDQESVSDSSCDEGRLDGPHVRANVAAHGLFGQGPLVFDMAAGDSDCENEGGSSCGGSSPGKASKRPRLGAPFPLSAALSRPPVAPFDAQFFLLERDDSLSLEHLPLISGGRRMTLFYYSSWRAPHLHFSLQGHWTPAPGWPFRRTTPPPGCHNGHDACWWQLEVPLQGGHVEFVLNDGGACWDNQFGGGNYQVHSPGSYALQNGNMWKM